MSVVVEVSARKFTVPHECACCGAVPQVHLAASHTRRTGKRVIRETTRGLNFPYCTGCDAHIAKWDAASALLGILVVLSALVAIGVGFGAGAAFGFGLFGALFILSFVISMRAQSNARALCAQACATPGAAVTYLEWSGSVSSFAFASQVFALKFAQANAKNLINVSMELHRLLEERSATTNGSFNAQSQPEPQRTAPVPASDDLVLEWISRIENYKGAEARRNALQRALAEVTDVNGRRALVLAASRIEVAAVLDKVEALASAPAKKRHLQKAIADIRADNIPDELQAEELRQLDARLRELH
jgi:hypothetical protein